MDKTVLKPWGKEIWLELNDKYCFKTIYINAGYKTSYQYHNYKLETNYLLEGIAEIWLEDENGIINKKPMLKGDSYTIQPKRKHRVKAISNIVIQEVSTPEVDDIIRLEDDTNRPNGKIEKEHNI